MKMIRSAHANDTLVLTENDIENLQHGVTLEGNAISVRLHKPDNEYRVRAVEHALGPTCCPHIAVATDVAPPNIKLVFDGNTGKLKHAEVI